MTTAFPGAVDAFTNPTATDALDSATVPHAAQHANINDAVEAIETYLLALNFGFNSGFYYRPNPGRTDATTPVVSSTYYLPFLVSAKGTFDRVAIQTSSTYVGTGAVRMGIYNNDVATNKPSTVVLDAGTVATTAASTVYEITISQTLTGGVYWLAFNMQTAPATPRYTGTVIGFDLKPLLIGGTAAFGTAAGIWVETGITGAFATAGTLATSTIAGSLSLRAL